MVEHPLAEKVALACNILAAEGQGDQIFGHITAREPHSDSLYMIPTGLGLEEITVKHVITIDLEGRLLQGSGRVPAEFPIHTEVYKMYPEINCVVHTHPFFSVVVGATAGTIKPIGHEGALFSNIEIFAETTGLISTTALGRKVALALKGKKALLLRNHGILVTGASLEDATVCALLLEKAARMQVVAHLMGSYQGSPSNEIEGKIEEIYNSRIMKSLWDYNVRKVRARRGP